MYYISIKIRINEINSPYKQENKWRKALDKIKHVFAVKKKKTFSEQQME